MGLHCVANPLTMIDHKLPDVSKGAPQSGALSRYTRDDSRYWSQRPRDHNVRGLYREGPQEAEATTNRLARLTRSRCREQAETPAAAHGRMRTARARARRSMRAREAFLREILKATKAA